MHSKNSYRQLTFVLFFTLVFFTSKSQGLKLPPRSEEFHLYSLVIDSIDHQNAILLDALSHAIKPSEEDMYLSKHWEFGILISEKDKPIFFKGRINVARGILECSVQNNLRMITPDKIKFFYLGGMKYIPVKGSSFRGSENNAFLNLVSLGPISLLRGYWIDVVYENGSNSLFPKATGQEKKVIQSRLYYSTDFKDFKEVRRNKKFITDLLTSKNNEVQDYAEINRLKFKSDRDISLIFDYFNQLN